MNKENKAKFWFRQGFTQMQIKHFEKALEYFNKAIKLQQILKKITTDIINKINYYLEKRRKNEGESSFNIS